MISALLFVVSLIPLVLGNDLAKEYAHVLVMVFVLLGAIGCYRKRDMFLFLTPNALIFFYTSISIGIGAWGFHNGFVIKAANLSDYNDWQFTHVALTLILLSLSLLLSIDYRYHSRYLSFATRSAPRCRLIHIVSASFLLLFFMLPVELSAFGGAGDFSIIGKSVLALLVVLYVSKYPAPVRWAVYLVIVVIFATFSVYNKREAIFLVLPMVYLELLMHRHRLTLAAGVYSAMLAGFVLALVLAMSVARGYGGFGEYSHLLQAVPLVTQYLRSDIFVAGLLNNIEVNYFFFHAINAIDMVIRDPELIAFGSTIVKPLFLLTPRSIVSWKPDSIISLYTEAHDPAFRARGGSWPISCL